jgi:hypothetical protein
MPANSETGIDPVVDRFVIWRMSTSQYTNMNATWPRSDGGPLVGANPDFQYFKKVNPEPPDVDHRFTLTTTFNRVPKVPAAPEGHPVGTYVAQFELSKLPLDDLLAQIETQFQVELQKQFPQTSNPSVLLEAADAVARKLAGATLTGSQQAILESIVGVGDAVTQLRARQRELIDAATANDDYDITTGWSVV